MWPVRSGCPSSSPKSCVIHGFEVYYSISPSTPILELAVSIPVYGTSHALSDVANAPSGAARRRYPPRRFVFSASAPPTAPHGPAFLASTAFQLDLHDPQRVA